MKRTLLLFWLSGVMLSMHAQNNPLFIFKQFVNARIHFKNRSVTVAPMNYDAANDKMYFKRDSQLMELLQLGAIDSVVWASKLCFVPYGNGFLEKVKLKHGPAFIHWKIKSVNIGARGALGAITQAKVNRVFSAKGTPDYSADIYKQKNANDYYLLVEGKFKRVTTLKQLKKLFPEHVDRLEGFFEEHRTRMDIPLSVLELLDYCLSLGTINEEKQ